MVALVSILLEYEDDVHVLKLASADVVHAISYSLLLLNTDLHVAELSSHMTKNQFVRNTIAVINAQIKPGTPLNSSTPDLPDDGNESSEFVNVDNYPAANKTRDKRSASVTSWRSASKDTLSISVPSAYQSSTQLSAPSHSLSPTVSSTSSPARRIDHKASSNSISSVVYARTWENDMENLLKVTMISVA